MAMNSDDILLDVEERMEKTIEGLKTTWPAFAPGGQIRAWSIRLRSRFSVPPYL